jgi:prepilin-type N-terminal cleavage/methylation domain-containing protein
MHKEAEVQLEESLGGHEVGKGMDDQRGFTVVELLATCLIVAVAVSLGALGTRHYWRVQSLRGGVEEITSTLRGQQQAAGSESHPYVWGAWFRSGTNRWGVVRGNVTTGACVVKESHTLDSGVTIQSVSFTDINTAGLTTNCSNAAGSGSEIVLFLARGTATGGSVSLRHPAVSGGAARTISVSPITGRITQP